MKVSYWKTMSMYLIPTISILPYRLGGGYIQLSFWKWHITFDWGGKNDMKSDEFIELKNALGEKGYMYTKCSFTNEDHSYYKAFGKYSNPWDEERSCFQIFFRVWDYTQFPQEKDRPYGVDVRISVSRVIDEVIDLDLLYDGQPISYFENKAESFYKWVIKNFEI